MTEDVEVIVEKLPCPELGGHDGSILLPLRRWGHRARCACGGVGPWYTDDLDRLARLDQSGHLREVFRREVGAQRGRVLAPDGPDLTTWMSKQFETEVAIFLTPPSFVSRRGRQLKRIHAQTDFAVVELHRRLWPAADAALHATLDAVGMERIPPTAPLHDVLRRMDVDLMSSFAAWADRGRRITAEINALGEPPETHRAHEMWGAVNSEIDTRIDDYYAAAQEFLDAGKAVRDGTAAVTDPALNKAIDDARQEDAETAAVEETARRIQAIRKGSAAGT